MKGPRRASRRLHGDEGAALIEFSLVVPLFLVLVFAIIDFGWALAQYLDGRHGAREGSRLVAVNYDPNSNGVSGNSTAQSQDIVAKTCESLDIADQSEVEIELVDSTADNRGDFARVTVDVPVEQLTGFFDAVLGDATVTSQVDTRLEQNASWDPGAGAISC